MAAANAIAEAQEGVLLELESLVSQDLQAVTYKWLARQFNLHVDLAKRVLEAFAKQHPGKVKVMHLVAGTRKGAQERVLQVVDGALLAEARASLDPITCDHVYSVSPLPQQQQQQQQVKQQPASGGRAHAPVSASLVQPERQQGLEAVAAALSGSALPPPPFSRAACSAVRGLHEVGVRRPQAPQQPGTGAARQPLGTLPSAQNDQLEQATTKPSIAAAAPAQTPAPAAPAAPSAGSGGTAKAATAAAQPAGNKGGKPSASSFFTAPNKQQKQQPAAAKPPTAAATKAEAAPATKQPPEPANVQDDGRQQRKAEEQAGKEEEEEEVVGKRAHKRGRHVLVAVEDDEEPVEEVRARPGRAPADAQQEAQVAGGLGSGSGVPCKPHPVPKPQQHADVGSGSRPQAGSGTKGRATAMPTSEAGGKRKAGPADTAPAAKATKVSKAVASPIASKQQLGSTASAREPEVIQVSSGDQDSAGDEAMKVKAASKATTSSKQHEPKPVPAAFAPRLAPAGAHKRKHKELQTVINDKGEEVTMEVEVEDDEPGPASPLPPAAPAATKAAAPVGSKKGAGGAGTSSSPAAKGASKGSTGNKAAQGKQPTQKSIQSFFSAKPGKL